MPSPPGHDKRWMRRSEAPRDKRPDGASLRALGDCKRRPGRRRDPPADRGGARHGPSRKARLVRRRATSPVLSRHTRYRGQCCCHRQVPATAVTVGRPPVGRIRSLRGHPNLTLCGCRPVLWYLGRLGGPREAQPHWQGNPARAGLGRRRPCEPARRRQHSSSYHTTDRGSGKRALSASDWAVPPAAAHLARAQPGAIWCNRPRT